MGDDYMYDFDDNTDDTSLLNKKANKENATENDILKAALANAQEQYRELSEHLIAEMQETMSNFDNRLRAIEDAITQSNREKDVNIASALESASETIIGRMKGKFDELDTAIEQRIEKLKDTHLKEAEESAGMLEFLSKFNITALIVFVIFIIFTGWQVFWCRDEVRDTTNAVNNATQKIEGGLYNSNGYSVLPGAKSSEAVYRETHPTQSQKK